MLGFSKHKKAMAVSTQAGFLYKRIVVGSPGLFSTCRSLCFKRKITHKQCCQGPETSTDRLKFMSIAYMYILRLVLSICAKILLTYSETMLHVKQTALNPSYFTYTLKYFWRILRLRSALLPVMHNEIRRRRDNFTLCILPDE
jgi:hypothetical protein